MNLGNIPGMYWDDEKKKYFRIQKNHQTTAKNDVVAKYSRDFVDNTKREKKHAQRRAKRVKREATETIKRNPLLQSTLFYRSTLEREIRPSTSVPLLDIQAASFAYGLRHRQPPIIPNKVMPARFAYDAERAIVYTIEELIVSDYGSRPLVLSMHPLTKRSQKKRSSRRFSSGDSDDFEFTQVESPTSTLCSGIESRVTTLMPPWGDDAAYETSLDVAPDGSLVCTHPLPDRYQALCMPPSVASPLEPSLFQPSSDSVHHSFTLDRFDDAWDVVANPYIRGGQGHFAIGAEKGLWLVTKSGHRMDLDKRPLDLHGSLAMTWTSAHTLAIGGRSKKVTLTDVRHETGSSTLRLQHDSLITNIRPGVQEAQLIVSGLDRSMKLYDLRMSKEGVTLGTKTATVPVFRFQGYENTVRLRHGFDTFRDLGIVASGIVDGIQVFSMRTGALLRTVKMAELPSADYRGEDIVRCLKFAEIDGEVSIIASHGRHISQCSW